MDDGRGDASGYDADFLRVSMDLPAPAGPTLLLDYTHFSVRLRPDRKLAAIVGVNFLGRELRPLARAKAAGTSTPGSPRSSRRARTSTRNNGLDRGHLVRRLDPVWGAEETAKTANQDTFTYTNAAP